MWNHNYIKHIFYFRTRMTDDHLNDLLKVSTTNVNINIELIIEKMKNKT